MFKKLFKYIFSKEISEWEQNIVILNDEKSQLDEELINLESKLSELESQVSPETEETSFITFFIDNELKISVTSKVNKELAPILVDNGIINGNEAENVDILQHALVLIANESSEQIIMGVNNEE